jgi:hypothetical protein
VVVEAEELSKAISEDLILVIYLGIREVVDHHRVLNLTSETSSGISLVVVNPLADRRSTQKNSIWNKQSNSLSGIFLLGTKISIESPYSGKFRVTVPECTKPGTRLKVTGKGKTSGKLVGDLYLKLDARMPGKLTVHQRELLEKLVK